MVTQKEWHQPPVWFIAGQLTDVQATCDLGHLSFNDNTTYVVLEMVRSCEATTFRIEFLIGILKQDFQNPLRSPKPAM